MFSRVLNAIARRSAESEAEHGLRLVRADWLHYRSENPKPPEDAIVGFVSPFIVPMLGRLATDRIWGQKDKALMLDLIFTVLRADAETEAGLAKLSAMREALVQGST